MDRMNSLLADMAWIADDNDMNYVLYWAILCYVMVKVKTKRGMNRKLMQCGWLKGCIFADINSALVGRMRTYEDIDTCSMTVFVEFEK